VGEIDVFPGRELVREGQDLERITGLGNQPCQAFLASPIAFHLDGQGALSLEVRGYLALAEVGEEVGFEHQVEVVSKPENRRHESAEC